MLLEKLLRNFYSQLGHAKTNFVLLLGERIHIRSFDSKTSLRKRPASPLARKQSQSMHVQSYRPKAHVSG